METGQLPRVVFLVPKYILDSVSFVVYQYAVSLRKMEFDAVICSLRPPSLVADPSVRAPIWNIFSCDTLVTNLFLPDLAGFLISRVFSRIKWIPFLHCDIVGGLAAEGRAFARLKACIWRAVLSRAELVISPSRYALRSLPSVRRATIIPHCIDQTLDAEFRDQAQATRPDHAAAPSSDIVHGACAGQRYVFIGRDTRGKRLKSLLQLLALDPHSRLKIIGAIDHSRSALDQLPPSQAARCLLLGRQFDPYRHVEPGEVVVCPSGREGFGLVPVECIARNIPVAVLDEGVFKELYGHTSMVYSRIADLPRHVDRIPSDLVGIRECYVGPRALGQRVALLVPLL